MLTANDASIHTERLELRPLAAGVLEAFLEDRRADAEALLGASLPADGWPPIDSLWIKLRLGQLRADASLRPWLARGIMLPDGTMVGTVGFHDRPNAVGMVEMGYEVARDFRRRGYAIEAVRGLVEWAFERPEVAVVRACIAPANEPSLGLIAQLGFARTGVQVDEIDGEELIFERGRDSGP